MSKPLPPLPAEPVVTVIVPSRNQGAFLDDTLQSIVRQDYPRLEVWVVDGGSTDGTLDVLKRYDSEPRVKWVSEPDRGYADAVNKGLHRALGEVIGIQSSDDFYAAGALREAIDLFALHPDMVMVSGTFFRVDENGTPYARYEALHEEQWLTVEQCARTGNYPCQSACFFRRDLALQVGGCDVDVDWVADHDLQVRMMAAGAARDGRTLKLNRCWSYVRTHPRQRNQERFKFNLAHVQAAEKYARHMRDLFTPRERRLMLRRAYWGEYKFRTRVLHQDVGAMPSFLRALRRTIPWQVPSKILSELAWMLPFGFGRRIAEGIRWRVNAVRSKGAPPPSLPATAKWFA